MALLSATILFILGLLAVSDFVTKQIPATQGLLDKITPIKGWLGLVFMIWGLVLLVQTTIGVSGFMQNGFKGMLAWITSMLIGGLEFGVGLLIGFEKLAALTGKGDNIEPLRAKLAPHQRNMGFLCLIVAAWAVVFSIVF
jgi:hypothetical protein